MNCFCVFKYLLVLLFSVEEDEPDEILTTNNHHLHDNSDENISRGLYQPTNDLHQSTEEIKTNFSNRKLTLYPPEGFFTF